MTSKIYLNINGHSIDTLEDASFEFRLNRFVQDSQNFQLRGGDSSYPLELPFTKNNSRIFGITFSHQAINKFNRHTNYNFELGINGVELLRGTCLIQEISPVSITVEFKGESIDWISQLEDVNLNRLGYVNNQPTWFGGEKSGLVFKGGETINLVNEIANLQTPALANRFTDYICPLLYRNNTPITDYITFDEADIFGLYDSGGNQVLSPLDFPDSFKAINGFYGSAPGLTFEDFPPAVYFRNILEKCFNEVGYNTVSSLFNEGWFNTLYMPYKGEEYLYNWKELAHLSVRFATGRNINLSGTAITIDEEVYESTDSSIYYYTKLKIGNSDDLTQRIDNVANFNKFLVTDTTNGYVVPAKGKYKIRMASQLQKNITASPSDITDFDTYGGFQQPSGQKGWGETVFVILRKSQTDETLLRENPLEDIAKWMRSGFLEFTETPSDIVAFVSPFQKDFFGVNNSQVAGSPLTNFQTYPTIFSTTYSEVSTVTTRESFSSCHFEIEVDLLKNERLEFYAIGLAQLMRGLLPPIPVATDLDCTINNNASLIEIDYLCGNEDISIADNLPDFSCKEFVKNFINLFNLRWSVDEKNKTVRFHTEKEFFNNDIPYDITSRVDISTIQYLPANSPLNTIIGYTNDTNDYELNQITSECIEDVNQASEYGNKSFTDNLNIYATNTQSYKSIFSATKFVNGNLYDCTDFNTITKTNVTIANPITGGTFLKGVRFGPIKLSGKIILPIPSMRSITGNTETTVGQLNYNLDQDLRLLQYLGTVGEVFNTLTSTNQDFRLFINSPDRNRMLESDFWIRPTISSFDFENISYASYITPYNNNNPTQSMRYDVSNGLYDEFFGDIINTLNMSYIFKAQAYLTSKDWNSLQGNAVIKYQDSLYRLLEISDYDVTGIEPSTIRMIKIV